MATYISVGCRGNRTRGDIVTLQRVPLIVDDFDGQTLPATGYKTADNFALYVSDETALWLIRVKPLPGGPDGTYREANEGAVILASGDTLDEAACERVYDRLRNMTAWDFVTSVLLPMRRDIQFDLA